MAKASPVLKELKAAVKGLLFPSETDAKLEAFVWPAAGSAEEALRANAEMDDATVAQVPLAELADTIPAESRGDFLPLFALLAHHLSGTTVFKVGEIDIGVYIVGRTDDGKYAGVRTRVVET
ncbi:MAG: nuclease A inhibitor family protein [Gemmataceae bacterium]|nr:nuclease A inhibitor family protein [Gemmataceae bacterium]